MAQKTVAVIVILLFLGAGFFIGSLAGGFVGQLTVPASHKAIVEDITIYDTVRKNYLEPYCIGQAKYKPLSIIPLQTFTVNKEYTFTNWIWGSPDEPKNPEVFMVIAGPGNDGKTYGIELSRSCWNELKITFGDGKTFTLPQVTEGGQASPGYIGYEYIP